MKKLLIVFLVLSMHTVGFSMENPRKSGKKTKTISVREDCDAGTKQIEQSINNVRATLLNSGDCWWNLTRGSYFVPNTPPEIPDVSSIFAASVWIGGYDPNGALKIAANTYRSNSSQTDFYPGPLNDFTGTTDKAICDNWDQFFTVYGSEIDKHIILYKLLGEDYPIDSVPDNVRYWPGKGNAEFQAKYGFALPDNVQGLGSFYDRIKDGVYDPLDGDYPIIEIQGCEAPQYPDEMIFWIYNDAGGNHGSTQGLKIQMEVQVQAFGYKFNNEINDMTFQRYKLINRAQTTIQDCYFAMWIDPDLGCGYDDYIGCDVERSLMYTYNEDAIDGEAAGSCECQGTNTYCTEVPILGVDYFRGPSKPVKYLIEDGDTTFVDLKPGEIADTTLELGMSSFTYYNNGSIGSPDPATIDPDEDFEFYNYLDGKWKNGTPFTFGGSGYDINSKDTVRYAFTGDPNNESAWSMCTAALPFGDRRTIQASGPFLLTQGALNELIIGAVWVPDQVYPCPELTNLRKADDLAQALFDNCFITLDGPDAPDVDYVQLDREVILMLTNDTLFSNNQYESYQEKDIYAIDSLAKGKTDKELSYNFEGYLIYQLRSPSSTSDLNNIDEARLVRSVDYKNGITTLYNWTGSVNPLAGNNEIVYTAEKMVEGSDNGVRSTFRITEDAFGDTDKNLVNHREYYFYALAYGYNEYEPFQPDYGIGQKTPFITGRRNLSVTTVIPRPMVYETLNTYYGDGPTVTRLQGMGNQGQFMELADGMHDKILAENVVKNIVYKDGAGPLRVKIVNPLGVQDGDFRLELNGSFDGDNGELLAPGSSWTLTDKNTNTVYSNYKSLDSLDEQIIKDYGISIAVGIEPGLDQVTENQGNFVGGAIEYKDKSKDEWLGIVPSGAQGAPGLNFVDGEYGGPFDPTGSIRNTGGVNMFPLQMARYTAPLVTPANRDNPGKADQIRSKMTMERLNNVDIVFTSDKDKWSKCIVLEIGSEDYTNIGYTKEGVSECWEMRDHPSVGKEADSNGNAKELGDGTTGFSYFPGYAIDVETGQRLNIFFAENSVYGGETMNQVLEQNDIGRDMMFNPNDQYTNALPAGSTANQVTSLVMGGQHFIYVSRTPYDGCQLLGEQLKIGAKDANIFRAARGLTWTGLPVLIEGAELLPYSEGLIPNDVTIKLRVDNTFGYTENFDTGKGLFSLNNENPIYEFSIRGKTPTTVSGDDVDEALSNISVVPNPYYAHSGYEITQNDSRVKITNVPRRCVISIYSLDGRFINQFKRDAKPTPTTKGTAGVNFIQEGPDVVWNIKNSKGIPVSSGIYLIHILDQDTGKQKTVKWFGINRKFDPSGL